MATILMPLPNRDFDPTETGVPWRLLRERGHRVVFATPEGRAGEADPRMVTGQGLGIFAPLMKADANGRRAYEEMAQIPEFRRPISYGDTRAAEFDAVILPGGHAPGMREYLESARLQSVVAAFFDRQKPVGAICHGVLLAARSRSAAGASVLHGKRTTGLTRLMELGAWALTCAYLGSYYRTYPVTVEAEIKAALARPEDFISGPKSLTRDAPDNLKPGFTVRDGAYLSARWPGDAHRFASEFAAMVQ
jgi:protease I